MSEVKKPRIIVFDIETSFLILAGWGLRDQNFGIDNVLEDWSITSFAAKVIGSNECLRLNTNGSRNDKALVTRAIKFLETADILVSQNGIGFDLPKINSRAAINKIGTNMLHRKMHVDLLRVGRSMFGHTSNKLAWISKQLTPSVQKSKHSKFEGIELWKEVDDQNPAAIKEMDEYNWQDVLATEAVYKEYIQWADKVDLNRAVAAKPKAGPVTAPCRICAEEATRKGTTRRTTGLFYKYLCGSCSVWTVPTGAGFNLDVVRKDVSKNPTKLENAKLRADTKVLAKKLQDSQARVEKLIKASQNRNKGVK